MASILILMTMCFYHAVHNCERKEGWKVTEKFRFCMREDGQAAVLLALAFTVLLGFTALTIDIGRVSVEKTNLQNSVDATSLAAAQELPNQLTATSTAEKYAASNGISEPIQVTFSDSDTKVTVTVSRTIKYTFARVIGFNTTTVNVSSAASRGAGSLPEAFDYAVFAGQGGVSFNGNGHVFNGSIYGKNSVNLGNDAEVNNGNVITSAGTLTGKNPSVDSGYQIITDNPVIPMPDLSEKIQQQGIVCNNQTEFENAVNGKTVNGPIYVNGNITINGRIKGNGIIYASGTIRFLNNDILQTASDSICFYAAQGDMTFNGGSGTVIGILYAPNGTIRVNGGPNCTIYGRMIAQNVDVNGSKADVYANAKDLDGINTLYADHVRLVK